MNKISKGRATITRWSKDELDINFRSTRWSKNIAGIYQSRRHSDVGTSPPRASISPPLLFPHRSSPLRSGKRYEEAREVSSRRRLYILRQWYVTLSNINNFRIFLPRLFPPPPNRPVYPNVAQSGSTANCRRDNRFHFRSSPFTSLFLSLFPLFRLNERTRIQYTISVSITVGRVREIWFGFPLMRGNNSSIPISEKLACSCGGLGHKKKLP